MTQQTPDFGDIRIVRPGTGRTRSTSNVAVATLPQTAAVEIPLVSNVITEPTTRPCKSVARRFWWLPIVAVFGIGLAVLGRNYYNNRYVGTDYWAQISPTQDMTLVERRDMDGRPVGLFGVDYTVTAHALDGTTRNIEFTMRGNDVSRMAQPGDFVWMSASRAFSLKERIIPESEVPEAVLAAIRSGN